MFYPCFFTAHVLRCGLDAVENRSLDTLIQHTLQDLYLLYYHIICVWL